MADQNLNDPPSESTQQQPPAVGPASQWADSLKVASWVGGPGLPLVGVVAIVGAGIALSLGLLKDINDILAPSFLAVNLLIAAYPIYTWLRRVKTPKSVAATVTGLAVFVILILGVGALVWSLTAMVTALTTYSEQFRGLYTSSIDWLAQLGFDEAALLNSLTSISPTSVLNVVGGLVSNLSVVGSLVVVIICVILFMVMDLPSMSQRLSVMDRIYPAVTNSLNAFVVGIRRYWIVTTVFGLIVAVFDWVLLLILGVPLPMVWAVLSFITNYIPNVGFVIGLVPPALLALFEGGPFTALAVVIGYSVLNFVIQSIIQPKFTGDAVGVTPVVSFLSLLLWAWVFGALGALIALPATLAVKALLIDPDPRMRWVSAFISNDPLSIDTRKTSAKHRL